jgi:hypothetical protein
MNATAHRAAAQASSVCVSWRQSVIAGPAIGRVAFSGGGQCWVKDVVHSCANEHLRLMTMAGGEIKAAQLHTRKPKMHVKCGTPHEVPV